MSRQIRFALALPALLCACTVAAQPAASPASPAVAPTAAPVRPAGQPTVSPQGGASAPAPRPAASAIARFAALEAGVIEEINRMRRDPAAYAALLEERLRYYNGSLYRGPSDTISLRTREGVAAVQEAITALRAQAALPELREATGMSRGARDHVADLGPRGGMGHDGADGSQPWDRVERYGDWQRTISENITFGPDSPRDVVIGLIVDDGVASRGHRKNLFDQRISVAGVSCGPHTRYRVVCVMVHAGGYTDKN